MFSIMFLGGKSLQKLVLRGDEEMPITIEWLEDEIKYLEARANRESYSNKKLTKITINTLKKELKIMVSK